VSGGGAEGTLPRAGTLRRIGRLSAVYGAGVVIGKAVAFLMLPLYTRYLTPADYGILALIDTTMEVISIVAGSRLASGVFHFYHRAAGPRERGEVLTSALLVLGASFAAAGAAAFGLAPGIAHLVFRGEDATGLIRIAAVNLGLQSLIIVPTAFQQVIERPKTLVAASVVRLCIQLVLNVVLLVGYRLGVRAVLISGLVSTIVVGVALTGMMVRQVGLRFSRAAAGDIVRFGVPFIGTHLARFVATFGDRYVLQAVSGPAVVGVYGLAYQFGFLLVALGDGPYRNAWEPMRFDVAKRPDRDAVFARAFIHLNLIQITLAVGLSLFAPEFLRVMATPPFYQAGRWAPIIIAAYVLQSWSLFLNTGLYVRERSGLITWATTLGAVAAVAGYAALIPPLGGLGAALATLLSFGVLFWSVYRYSQREWPIAYRWAPVARLVAAGAVVCGLSYLLPPLGLVAALGAKGALFGLYAAAVWFLPVLTAGERDLVRLLVTHPRRALASLQG
jgi:O-antigen/teichoic acid export membrane protein